MRQNIEEAQEKQKKKKDEKLSKYLEQRGIQSLDENTLIQVERIIRESAGLGLMKAGTTLSFAKAEEQLKIGYLSTIAEQNWILIKQNQDIIAELRRISNK
ncbi:TPA: hypothetical protein U0919_000055 [Streptococcus suis]|nr:hypothetical protein [Streptococcus suis]